MGRPAVIPGPPIIRDLAARKNGVDFHNRLEVLRAGHARKPTLIERLHKAGL